jgi:hypothetical protein
MPGWDWAGGRAWWGGFQGRAGALAHCYLRPVAGRLLTLTLFPSETTGWLSRSPGAVRASDLLRERRAATPSLAFVRFGFGAREGGLRVQPTTCEIRFSRGAFVGSVHLSCENVGRWAPPWSGAQRRPTSGAVRRTRRVDTQAPRHKGGLQSPRLNWNSTTYAAYLFHRQIRIYFDSSSGSGSSPVD